MMGLLRSIFWFEKGELSAIHGKFTARKWGYETRWEADVLFPLVAFVLFAFIINIWLGGVSVWAFKQAIRALNEKGFFDPLP
jgi:hypothetical protein